MLGHGSPFHMRAPTPNLTRPGSGLSGACLQFTDTNAASFKGFLDLLHFVNYFLSFGANSEFLGEVT